MADIQSASAPNHPEWQSLVDDVEQRFLAVNMAVTELRLAVDRLSSYTPVVSAPIEVEMPSMEIAAEAVVEMPSEMAVPEVAIEAVAETVAPEVMEPAAYVEEPAVTAPAQDDDQARRDEVSRMVAQARQEMETHADSTSEGSWPGTPSTLERDFPAIDSTSEGSWPMARPQTPSPSFPQPEPVASDPEKAWQSVPDVVAEAASVAQEAEEDDEARRQEVARMVAEMRAGLSGSMAEAAEESQEDDVTDAPDTDQARRDVARMVAEMRATLGQGGEDAAGDYGYSNGHVAEESAPAGEADDAQVRDEVRRAVEAARAEMASGWVSSGASADSGAATESKFSFPDWQNARVEPSGPPVIVIKDTEGRVELARVYETLSHVNCDENAALLNYTPHSVTVGLNLRAPVPTAEAMEAAVRKVFGRKCRVESDGVRLSVDIGKDLGKEDAA